MVHFLKWIITICSCSDNEWHLKRMVVMCPTSDFKKGHGILQFQLIVFQAVQWGEFNSFSSESSIWGKKKKMKRPFICELCFPLFTRLGAGGKGFFWAQWQLPCTWIKRDLVAVISYVTDKWWDHICCWRISKTCYR